MNINFSAMENCGYLNINILVSVIFIKMPTSMSLKDKLGNKILTVNNIL